MSESVPNIRVVRAGQPTGLSVLGTLEEALVFGREVEVTVNP
jgi:hypothetical protein